MRGKLYGIGVGPGDPELVTLKAVRVMGECHVIAIPGKNPRESVAYEIARGACPKIDEKEKLYVETPMTKDAAILEQGYQAAADSIEELLESGKNVGMLTLGDPTIYSTYIYIHRIIKEKGFETEIISGVTSVCAVAAKLGDSLVDRHQKLHIIPASYQVEEALELEGTKVLMKAGSQLSKVNQILQNSQGSASMIENCGMEQERIYRNREEFPQEGSYYSIMVVKDE